MFRCETSFSCDKCGKGYTSSKTRMTDCTSKAWYEKLTKEKGWKVLYKKYHICNECVEHYGVKYLRNEFKYKFAIGE